MKPIDLSKVTTADLKNALRLKEQLKKQVRAEYKHLVAEIVPESIEVLLKVSRMISEAKTAVFGDLQAVIDLKHEVYGVKKSGQQSHTFTDVAGNSITLGYRVTEGWDDTVNEGIAKVRTFLDTLSVDDKTSKLIEVIHGLLKKDAMGNLKASRVVELFNLTDEFDDEGFSDGVTIIHNAYKPMKSCYFIEGSQTDEQGKKIGIPLSISAVGFTKKIFTKV